MSRAARDNRLVATRYAMSWNTRDRRSWDASPPLTNEQLDAVALEQFRILKSTFATTKSWEVEKSLGHGSYGFTALLRDTHLFRGTEQKRYVLKRALVPQYGTDDITNEMVGLRVRQNYAV